ncbi:MAG: ANTAR domain-containing response regulator [Nevskia sp.]
MSIRVLIIDARSERSRRLELALAEAGFEVLDVVAESGDVHGRVQALKPDAILIDSESPTRDTLEGLASISDRFPRPILLLSDQAQDNELVRSAAQIGVSAYVIDGVSALTIRSLIEVAIAHFDTRRTLFAELEQTQRALHDRRIIDRAKCALMESHGLSEHEAYHRLRRGAMTRGLKLVEMAAELIEKNPLKGAG